MIRLVVRNCSIKSTELKMFCRNCHLFFASDDPFGTPSWFYSSPVWRWLQRNAASQCPQVVCVCVCVCVYVHCSIVLDIWGANRMYQSAQTELSRGRSPPSFCCHRRVMVLVAWTRWQVNYSPGWITACNIWPCRGSTDGNTPWVKYATSYILNPPSSSDPRNNDIKVHSWIYRLTACSSLWRMVFTLPSVSIVVVVVCRFSPLISGTGGVSGRVTAELSRGNTAADDDGCRRGGQRSGESLSEENQERKTHFWEIRPTLLWQKIQSE